MQKHLHSALTVIDLNALQLLTYTIREVILSVHSLIYNNIQFYSAVYEMMNDRVRAHKTHTVHSNLKSN